MELLVVAVIGGVVLAFALVAIIWRIMSRAVDNGVDWLIYNFGNEPAAKIVEEKWRRRDS